MPLLKHLGNVTYQSALQAQADTIQNSHREQIQLISFEPKPVITLGLRAAEEVDFGVPILKVDRGGEATYHGPGQILFFPVIHLPTWQLTVKEWVELLLRATAASLNDFSVSALTDMKRPGVFTQKGKIASVGLKIQNGWNRHGLALNVSVDLEPFAKIRTCGVEDAKMDRISEWLGKVDMTNVAKSWALHFEEALSRHLLNTKLATKVDRPNLF